MHAWLWMTLISGVLLGFYDIFKKKALKDNSVFGVLALYSFFSFLIVSFEFSRAFRITRLDFAVIMLKSVIIFASWTMGFIAIKHMPISIITPFGTLSPLFSIVLGIAILQERLGYLQLLGIMVILVSYYFIGKAGKSEIAGLFKNKYLYLMAGSALLSATSALIDKIALKQITSGQMQFWFCFFLTVFYLLALLISGRMTGEEKPLKLKFSVYILLMSILIVLSDRIYFEAVKMPLSQISIVMPLRKISVFVSAIIGGIIFKEKNIRAKLACVLLLVAGITIAFIGK